MLCKLSRQVKHLLPCYLFSPYRHPSGDNCTDCVSASEPCQKYIYGFFFSIMGSVVFNRGDKLFGPSILVLSISAKEYPLVNVKRDFCQAQDYFTTHLFSQGQQRMAWGESYFTVAFLILLQRIFSQIWLQSSTMQRSPLAMKGKMCMKYITESKCTESIHLSNIFIFLLLDIMHKPEYK